MEWQFCWHCWHLGWTTSEPDELNVRTHYVFIGPLQMKWYV
jgi:hypothetical protein